VASAIKPNHFGEVRLPEKAGFVAQIGQP
jgi:hypothetical protein